MSIKPSANLVKQSLNAHSAIGLFISALLYFICLSGSLAVFFEEFERWEQPEIAEYHDYSATQIDQAVTHFLARSDNKPDPLYIVLPTEAVPRMHISDEQQEWFIEPDGSLTEPVKQGWTLMLKKLHNQLHLPEMIGMLIVGIVGVLLCSLILSGLFAHPRIFKDAFHFRRGGSPRIALADLHNRLSVWGTPFYLMISLSGAFIGLSSVFIASSAYIYYDNDTSKVVEIVYGDDPVINGELQSNDYQAAFDQLAILAPTAKPIYLALHNLHTKQQYFEIAATLPDRLIYSEMYRFNANGEFINHQGFTDGPAGRQIAYSVYRLHFGHFDGLWVKVLYALLGLALTIVSATGINIWLSKRKYRNSINDLWLAIVWGSPIAFTFSAAMSLLGFQPLMFFAFGFSFSLIVCLWLKNDLRSRGFLIEILSVLLIVTAIIHCIQFGFNIEHSVSYAINISLVIIACILTIYGKSRAQRPVSTSQEVPQTYNS